jgi:hypothetical protein
VGPAAAEAFDGNNFLRELAGEMQQRLRASQAEVAHLKMTLSPDSGQWDLGVVNLVRNDFLPELSMSLARRAFAVPAPSMHGAHRRTQSQIANDVSRLI